VQTQGIYQGDKQGNKDSEEKIEDSDSNMLHLE
jgi:hypothetical protein